MARRAWTLVKVAIPVVLLLAFIFAPLVTYTQSISIPGNYTPGAVACSPTSTALNGTTVTFSNGTTTTITSINATAFTTPQQFQQCLDKYQYPPLTLQGYGSLSYAMAGMGTGPFPSQMLLFQGNMSALVFFDQGRAVSGEVLGQGEPTLNPEGVAILNSTVTQQDYGQFNLTAVIANEGSQPALAPIVTMVGLPIGNSSLAQLGNSVPLPASLLSEEIHWLPRYYLGACLPEIDPGQNCKVSTIFGLNYYPHSLTLPASINYTVEIKGFIGGKLFVTRQGFDQPFPSYHTGPLWVGNFVDLVNGARGSPGLQENSTLDRFAALRFATAVTKPDISDYNLYSDASAFFGPASAHGITELLLFPGISDPANYAAYLRNHAPGHWSDLTDRNFTQYGFFIGSGPYELVSQPCSLSEVPGAGVNITQYFESAGCAVTTQQATWLVIILQT